MSIDQSKHSLFGASKVAGDVVVQEYGKYFGISTCCLQGGLPHRAKSQRRRATWFLSYLIKCAAEASQYTIFGYKGKQVRDNLHAVDVARFIHLFYENPRSGEVYNLGGGRENTCSILEAFSKAEGLTGQKMDFEYLDKPREGDHICYVSNLDKIQEHYPAWSVTHSLDECFQRIYLAHKDRVTGYEGSDHWGLWLRGAVSGRSLADPCHG